LIKIERNWRFNDEFEINNQIRKSIKGSIEKKTKSESQFNLKMNNSRTNDWYDSNEIKS
jgi:hypothetical protein